MNQLPAAPPKPFTVNYELSYFDETNPYSLVNMLPPQCVAMMAEKYCKFLLGLSLTKRKNKIKPDTQLNRLRVAFWREYDDACANRRKVEFKNIYGGTCSQEYFYTVIEDIESFVWLITPTPNYQLQIEEALHFGIERMREILEMPLYERKETKRKDNKGYVVKELPNVKLAALMVKIVEMLDARVKGAVPKTIANHTTNILNNTVNTAGSTPSDDGPIDLNTLSLDDLNRLMGMKKLPASGPVEADGTFEVRIQNKDIIDGAAGFVDEGVTLNVIADVDFEEIDNE